MRPPSLFRRRCVAIGVAGLVLVATAALLGHLARTAPTDDVAAPQPDRPIRRAFLTCDDRLPTMRPVRPGERPPPVGRVVSTEVLECPRHFDGHAVEYAGEVVGDVLRRRNGAWVLVNDDAYALEVGPLNVHRDAEGTNSGLAVWLPDPLSDQVRTPGRAGVRGDIIRVTGVLHRTDPADGGGLTIRATTAEIVSPAEPAPAPFDRTLALFASVAGVLALGVSVGRRRRRHGPR